MNEIEKYYNKFNEDKRLNTRHGQVEFFVTMHYIEKYIKGRKGLDILEVGAGTGKYSIALSEKGHNVCAVELVKQNLVRLKEKNSLVDAKLGNALDLKYYKDCTFDITLVLGPMYHLFSIEDKIRVLQEAKRVTKEGGFIFVAYLMNEYAVVTYAFKEGNLIKCIESNMLDKDFRCRTTEKDLYSYIRTEDINKIRKMCGLKRKKLIAVDGATDYIRPTINKMSKSEFDIYLKYQLKICERWDLLGASSHTLDILQK